MTKIFSVLGKVLSGPVMAPIKLLVKGQVTQRIEAVVQGQVRHVLSAGAGYLAAQGFLSGSDTEVFVAALTQAVAMLMSAAEKKAGL